MAKLDIEQQIYFYPDAARVIGRRTTKTVSRLIERGAFKRDIDPVTGKPKIYRDEATGRPFLLREELVAYLKQSID
jgi:hypothetical protein